MKHRSFQSFHGQLRKQFKSAIKGSCNKKGCKLDLSALSSYAITIIDADEYVRIRRYKGKICDYFLFFSDTRLNVSTVEMKGGKADVSEAVEQLQAGANECQKLAASYSNVGFYPVLLVQHIDPIEIKALQSNRVRFQGKKYFIIQRKCGSKFRDILRI